MSHIWRGLIGTAGMMISVIALTSLPLPEAVAISYATPLLLVVFGALFLRETVHGHRWAAVTVGLLGVLVISWPRLTVFSGGASPQVFWGTLAAISSCGFSAGVVMMVKQLVRTERSATIVLYFFLTSTVISAASLPFGWVEPTPGQWLIMIGVGLTSVVGQLLMTESYRHADVSVLAPIDYLSLVLSVLLGYFIFAEVPTWQMLVGGGIVLATGLYLILRERGMRRR
jgi:drug/metabolite transporter (DMT)-like permease